MVYKIMSTVKARLNSNGDIVSPTQTLLQNNILKTSELMPEKLRAKIKNANLVVDKNSLCKNNICKGDIYIETADTLSVLEQRHLIDAMFHISIKEQQPVMMPMVIRTSPAAMPKPTLADTDGFDDTTSHNDTAFLATKISVNFGNEIDVRGTYRTADTITKSLNKELNPLRLRVVFADMSVCTQGYPIKRDCYVIMQKTSSFNEDTYSDEALISAIRNGFNAPKMCVAGVDEISVVPTSCKPGLIGSMSLENTQLAAQRAYEQALSATNMLEAALVFSSLEKNVLFANGIGEQMEDVMTEIRQEFKVSRGPRLTEPIFSKEISCGQMPQISELLNQEYESSTESDLSTKWRRANAFLVDITGDKSEFLNLYKNAQDIILTMNEQNGSDEHHPFITGISFGTKISAGERSAQTMYVSYDPAVPISMGESVTECVIRAKNDFKEIIVDYCGNLSINADKPKPIMSDVLLAKPSKTLVAMMQRQMMMAQQIKETKEQTLDKIYTPSDEKSEQISL